VTRQTGFRWVYSPQQAFPELGEAYATAVHNGVVAIANRWAPEIQNWMKDNAPWTDRTGNARQTLYTEVRDVTRSMVELILSHGVEYGLWLEVRWAGRWGIVNPALDHFAPQIWGDVTRMLS